MPIQPLCQLSALTQQPFSVQSSYINQPVVVQRPPRPATEHPAAVTAKISSQASGYPIPEDCLLFCKSPIEFDRCHPFFDHIFVSAAIFTPTRPTTIQPSASTRCPYYEPRLLILKRSATDPDGYANRWEIPSGPCEAKGRSILHFLEHAVRSQTSLNVSSIVRQIGKGHVFTSEHKVNPEVPGDENWYKPCIEVQCAEIQAMATDEAFHTEESFRDMVSNFPVTPDSGFHQAWAWMTKKGAQLMLDGQVPGELFVDTLLGRRAIRAFEIREGQGLRTGLEGCRGRKRHRENDSGVQ
ncbi:MAG: hypothetical protein Q9216_005023 [Gyalolechia sp. 2 TL-2023]